MELLQVTWFFIIGIMLAVYAVLDGFDLGISILTPFITNDDNEVRRLYTAIGPIWDGNEVFIIAGGALLFAAFPQVYATVFSGFYLALMLLLFALIFRAVSLEFWSLYINKRNVWKWAFAVSSLLISLLYGVALGNVIVGIPIDGSMKYTGTFFTLLRPFPLSVGLLGVCAILLQGSTFAAVKTSGTIQEKARKFSTGFIYLFIIVSLLTLLLSFIFLREKLTMVIPWLFMIICIGSLIYAKKMIQVFKDKHAFVCSSISFLSLWGITGSLLFPNLVNALDKQYSLSIYNSSSSKLTLQVMLIIIVIGLPLVAFYMRMVYKTFKGVVPKQDAS